MCLSDITDWKCISDELEFFLMNEADTNDELSICRWELFFVHSMYVCIVWMYVLCLWLQYVLFVDIEFCVCVWVRVCVSVAFPCDGVAFYFSMDILSELNLMMMMMMMMIV